MARKLDNQVKFTKLYSHVPGPLKEYLSGGNAINLLALILYILIASEMKYLGNDPSLAHVSTYLGVYHWFDFKVTDTVLSETNSVSYSQGEIVQKSSDCMFHVLMP